MPTITTRITEELDNHLSILSNEIDRNKAYIIRRAIETYLEEKADLLIALARIEKGEATISLEDIEKKYGLAD